MESEDEKNNEESKKSKISINKYIIIKLFMLLMI